MSIVAENDEIRISTKGMSADEVRALVDWLRIEVIARKSKLTESAAWTLSEQIKSGWWEHNKGRFAGE
jgi:hypothetical protein